MYHNFFIHSSVNGPLVCFHDLAIVNSAAKNIGMHISFQVIFFFPLDIYPGVGLHGHIVALFLGFKDPPYCSP